MRKYKIVLILMIHILFITGCWDKREIEKRAFVLLIAIDKAEEDETNKKSEKPHDQEDRYKITFAYPNAGLIAGKGEGEPKYSYTSVGKNMMNIIEMVYTRLGRKMVFSHTKAIIIGESIARDDQFMREVLDTIERNPEIGRKVHLMITPGKASDIIDTSTKDEPVLGLLIRELMEQKSQSARVPDADLGYILRSLHESHGAIAPKIISSENEFKIAGAAVLKEFKMVGWLGEIETEMLMFMLDKVQGSEIDVEVDGVIIPIQITDSTTKKKVYQENGNIITSFEVEAEGDLLQHLFETEGEPFDVEYMKKVEKIVAKELEEEITKTYKEIQKDYGVDLIQAGEYLRKHEPDLWDNVRDNWEEIYPKTKVEVQVDMKIRRVGVTR